jgi:hypothetical protein
MGAVSKPDDSTASGVAQDVPCALVFWNGQVVAMTPMAGQDCNLLKQYDGAVAGESYEQIRGEPSSQDLVSNTHTDRPRKRMKVRKRRLCRWLGCRRRLGEDGDGDGD